MSKRAPEGKKQGPESKQPELPGTPVSTPLRDRIIDGQKLKEKIGSMAQDYKEIMDDIRKMMRDEKRKSVSVEDDDGSIIPVNLVPTGEKVKYGKKQFKKGSEELPS